jgi:hypothetical protein
MRERDPAEEFADEVANMLQMIMQLGTGPLSGTFPAETMARISKLEHDVAYFRQLATSYAEDNSPELSGDLPARKRRVLERIKQLRTEAVTIILLLKSSLGRTDTREEAAGKEKPRPKGKKKNWMKM